MTKSNNNKMRELEERLRHIINGIYSCGSKNNSFDTGWNIKKNHRPLPHAFREDVL